MTRAQRVLAGTGFVAGAAVARHRALRWGATLVERAVDLPGDGLLVRSDLTATRAITVAAPPERIWPWLVQLGWGRGGFYSYDALENLIGLGIHSAERVEPQWQDLAVGDQVHLAPQVGLDVRVLEPGRALVLAGTAPQGGPAAVPYDFTWAFVLRPGPEAGTTRLVVRERYLCRTPLARPLVEVVSVLSTLMTERMLRGVRDRAERSA